MCLLIGMDGWIIPPTLSLHDDNPFLAWRGIPTRFHGPKVGPGSVQHPRELIFFASLFLILLETKNGQRKRAELEWVMRAPRRQTVEPENCHLG